ncbi:nitrile hydratase [Pelagophyceae sp. CCMP2097]|nr:nitrile hydratase [Pelagophyceae sp. CCMP2097]
MLLAGAARRGPGTFLRGLAFSGDARRPCARLLHTAGAHDVGGLPSLQAPPIDTTLSNVSGWEAECHALFAVLARQGRVSTDGLRRAVEGLAPQQYETWTYYERWSASLAELLREEGTVSPGELEAALFGDDADADAAAPCARFAAGQRVRVLDAERRRTQWRRPHLRTPGYVYGATGTVERVCGRFADPSLAAYGAKAFDQRLYRVAFDAAALWQDVGPAAEVATAGDAVEVEIYESWLEEAVDDDHPSAGRSADHASAGGSATAAAPDHSHDHGHHALGHSHAHAHGHDDHAHAHSHGHDGHVHLRRDELERAAVDKEGPPRPGEAVHHALLDILVRKGVVSRLDVNSMITQLQSAGARLDGARLVARAWTDASFRAALLQDGNAAAKTLGINASNPNAPTMLTVVENTAEVHNVIVCTLCSCYPAALLGLSPPWYKSRNYRARAVRNPRNMLLEAFELAVPASKKIRVHDSTADLRYLVLPMRPPGTDGLDEDALRQLVTRDSMLGTAVL